MKKNKVCSNEFEHQAWPKHQLVLGIDEAGRGPIAGPLCVAGVVFPFDYQNEDIYDSKALSEKKREALYEVIKKEAISYAVATASVEEIDTLNILNASQLAMRRAVAMLSPCPDAVLVDGNVAREFSMHAKTLIKGDSKSMSVAAASILAKVERDRYMTELDRLYPQYFFAKHKGYSTKLHMDLVRELGPSDVHRKTFLKFLNK